MNTDIIKGTPLFKGIEQDRIELLLKDANGLVKHFNKDDYVFHNGEFVQSFGLILEGSVRVEAIDIQGNRNLLGTAGRGHIFAESYACSVTQPILVDVIAGGPSEVLFINIRNVLMLASKNADAAILIQNLLMMTARKNIGLSMRIFHSSPKKIRDRLFSYFSEQTMLAGSDTFAISFDREQLADYLNVDRTALSKELGKMKREGLIDFKKNRFTLKLGNRKMNCDKDIDRFG